MNRLTTNSEILDGRYELKCLCNEVAPEYKGNCRDYCELNADCEFCGIREAFDRLAAYENTELTSEEIVAMKAKCADISDKHTTEIQEENERLHKLVNKMKRANYNRRKREKRHQRNLRTDCENCSRNNFCKHKKQYEELVQTLINMSKLEENTPFSISAVYCFHWQQQRENQEE